MDPFNLGRGSVVILGGVVALGVAGGCAKAPSGPPPVADVRVVTVEQRDVPVVHEWVGTLDGFVNAKIRAQVSGYLVKQDYREGAAVKKGDVLFEIDPRPFEAALAQANGLLAQAKAQLGKAELDVARDTPLAQEKAISQQELDDAVQGRLAALAQVQSAQAGVDQAELNLGFTRVSSPIDGIAGLISAQIGDLVGPTTGMLTTVSDVDPIKAVFPVSEQAYLQRLIAKDFAETAEQAVSGVEFDLILSDGSVYPRKGRFFAIDNQVNANTGTLQVVAVFPNPNGVLRAGQYAKVRTVVSVEKGALLVPQRALNELQGGYQLATVDASNHTHILTVKTGQQVGSQVVVESGLHPGDRVVADGPQKITEGSEVNPVPFVAEPSK
jgi:membrane fusion protein (multidrug efflux system)